MVALGRAHGYAVGEHHMPLLSLLRFEQQVRTLAPLEDGGRAIFVLDECATRVGTSVRPHSFPGTRLRREGMAAAGIAAVHVVEHAMQCFAKIVRALLRSTAVAADKLICGGSLDILGVNVKLKWHRFTLCPVQRR